jgi:NAD+ diphosphatase
MGDVFVPLTRPQQESNDSALWFAFQGSRMLVEAASTDAGVVPRCLDLEQIGLKVRRTQYLGLLDGQHCYSAELDDESAAPPGMAFEGLRGLLGQFDDTLIGVASRAFQVMDWDRKHQFCGQCGAPTRARANERARDCPNCRISSYPKICPAMMVLVTRGREILLGRKFSFAKNRYSALAGFVEAGESLEQTIAREVREEVGVEIGAVHYFGSQSWPFPNSLMIAFTADYAGGEIRPDGIEIEEARWFDVAELPAVPDRISISRWLIDGTCAALEARYPRR